MDKKLVKWTEHEEEIIANHPDASCAELQKLLPNRTASSIIGKRLRMFPNRKQNASWTEEERNLLRQLRRDQELSWKEIYEHFPERSNDSIRAQYSYMRKKQWI